ncbi:uncharacterized protein TNIN_25441 [Trichonephila inaurata madagascariensis]|uniref:Uncharacterized protein n=3 Tax=Trichonephila inaurata madagascariensis TaxID=2747483 RepID=A0A8X6YUQ1_9ARAC|nr:uncharacterized protein TNIN_25441 [Trichonephila inaurata madagascariensis]
MDDGFPYKMKKPKQSSYAKYKSFTSFMKTIMKTSLITSFPVIATSKSWIKRILKIIVFIMCLIGFSYQTLDFLWMYLGYPTVVNVFISNPYEIVQPGVTICNKNRRRRTFFCDKPGYCSPDNPVEFCKNYPEKCPGKKPSLAYPWRPYLNMLAEDYYYWDETFEESHNATMIDICEAKIGMKTLPCKNFTQIPVIDAKGEPNTCITIDSLVGQPDAEDTVHPNTYILELTLKTQAEEYISFTDPVMLQIMIHNRRAIINPFSEGSSLQSGAQYNVYVSQTTKERLPAPYDTDCVDYLAMWRENNGTGPLDHMMCVERCKLLKLLDMGECIDKDVDYPHEEDLCKKGVFRYGIKLMEKIIL